MLLTIITASYNRDYCLGNIYESIINNKFNEELEWILVDDGSEDSTSELAEKWLLEARINFRYYKITNGGKTRAVHFGFSQNPKGEYTFVLDSDDYLSANAIETIKNNIFNLTPKHLGLIGLKSDTKGKIIGKKFTIDEASYIDIYFGKNAISGDKLFIIKTEVYKSCIVLPFSNEKFMPDNLPYIQANNIGNYKLINEILYLGDYLEDGMTSNIYKTAIKNINGYIYEKKMLQSKKLLFKYNIINNIKYIHYSILAKKTFKEMYSYSNNKFYTFLLYIPTFIVFYRLRLKYPTLSNG